MKKLSDSDIENMGRGEFYPDNRAVNRAVRAELKLGHLIPPAPVAAPRHSVLDLHNKTEEQAWDSIMALATSGTHSATVITGASGILKIKFPEWATESRLSPYIVSFRPINNGSFYVIFRWRMVIRDQ
mgnify:CR=1 FL=1